MERETDYPINALEQTRVRKLTEAGFADLKKIPDLEALCAVAKAHFGTESAVVTLLTKENIIFKARTGIDVEQTPRRVAFCNYTILEDKVFVVHDALSDLRFRSSPLTAGAPFIRFYAGAPLTYLADTRIGAFGLLDSKPRQVFSLGDKAELIDFAERAVGILVAQLGKVS